MAVPKFDVIADLIVSRLEAGTYTTPYKIKQVVRPNQKHGNYQPGAFICTVQLDGFEPADPYEEDGPFYNILATYWLETEVLQDEESEEPHDRLSAYLVVDMANAITAADDDWAQWGGNAMNSKWVPWVRPDGKGGAITAVGLMIEVHVRVSSVTPI